MNFADRFYSVAELADLTGYHPDSIYRAIASGTLAAAKPRGKWLIAGPAIDAWLQPGSRRPGLAAQCRVRALADPATPARRGSSLLPQERAEAQSHRQRRYGSRQVARVA